MSKLVRLKEEMPFLFKGTYTFFKVGEEFEVVEEKVMPLMGLGYKLRSLRWNIILEGFTNANDFEELKP